MAENIIDAYSELPAPEILPTVPQLPAPELPPTAPQLPDPDIANIIPDDLRQIIFNSQDGQDITGANHLTVTEAGKVVTPSGQDRDPETLKQIAQLFDSTVTSIQSDPDLFEIPAALRNNSLSSGVTEHFPVEILANSAIPYNVNYDDETDVFRDANQLQSWLATISSPISGVTPNLFFNADNYDNLIEIRPEDAQQPGGIRAWGGNDKVMGTPNSDTANGNEGNDRIFGYGGNDLLMGGAGDDYLAGGAGMDVLVGEAGIDELIGNAGDDILMAQGDGDFLTGSTGADQFILCADTLMNDAAYAHRILDFNPNQGDTIKIADFKGIPGINQISFASVDVNLDDQADTAIFCSDGVVGVIMSKDLSQMNLTSSIFMVGPQDLTLTKISQFSMLSSQ